MMKKDRNQFIDIIRGIAMLLVVLGHTMTGCTVDSQQSLLFNIVWSLQMPLFILISGYVTKYSCTIWNVKGLFKYIKRRTVAYMLPWFVWSFLIRGIVFGQKGFLDIKSLIWNMDSGYWFLATIWSISMIFGVASYVAELVGKDNNLKKQMTLLIVYILGMVVLASIGILLGMSFFAIKLTLYYMPFYYLGYLYGQYDARILDCEKRIVDFVIASSFIIWLFVILRISIYEMPDNGLAIIMRAGISLAGCIAISGLSKGIFTNKSDFFRGGAQLDWSAFSGNLLYALPIAMPGKNKKQLSHMQLDGEKSNFNKLCDDGDINSNGCKSHKQQQMFCIFIDGKEKIKNFFLWAGKRSLEIYMIHGLLLNILKPHRAVAFSSIEGYFLTFGNFIITIGLCAIVIELLKQNVFLKKLLSIK